MTVSARRAEVAVSARLVAISCPMASSATMTAVTSVVFDVGGVLLDWDPRRLYRSLIPDEAELDRFLTDVCSPAFNAELDAGRSFDDACTELAERHPDHAELIHAWKRQDEMVGGEIPGVADLVRRLRLRGVPRYLLTNMPTDVFAARATAFPILGEFQGAVVSGAEGILKPSPAIFALLAARFGLVPAETLFIDDAEVNVAGARAAGYEAHRFVDAATLEAELLRLGLLDGS
jgi:2-haloacid dehalogenase